MKNNIHKAMSKAQDNIIESGEKNKSIKKNAILNVIKQVLKMAFPLITFPYISRVLLDENFGKYNFAQSIVNYFALIAGLGVSAYGIREGAKIRENPKKLNEFSNQLFTINMISTALSYAALLLLCLCWRKLDSYHDILAVLSGVIIFNTLGADWINSIYEDYEYMTKRYIFVKVIALVLIFLMVKHKEDYVVYGVIMAGTDMLANLINIFYIRRYTHLHLSKPHFRKHIFPLLVLFANTLAITIYTNSDITMLGIFQDDSVVGIYSVASKMNQIVKNLINAVIMVTIPRLAAYIGSNNKDKYNLLLKKTIKAIITFMFPMIAGMFMLSNEIIMLIGGETYIDSILALRILSVALIPAVISSVYFDGVLIVNCREKYCLISTITGAIVNIILNLILIPVLSLNGAAITTVVAELCSCLMAIHFSSGYQQLYFKFDRDFLSVILGTIMVIIVCSINNRLFQNIKLVAIDIIFATALYLIIQIALKNSVIINIVDSIKRKIFY